MAEGFFDKTHLMCVHLDIRSRMNLQPLADAFGKVVHVVYCRRIKGGYEIRMVHSRFREFPEPTIAGLCRAVDKLPRSARTLWNRSSERTFDIGIESGRSSGYWFALKPKTLKTVAELGARVVVTVYRPDELSTQIA